MNYNQINRNSLMSGLYTDRPTYNCTPHNADEQHLNPSKSKVNIRQSLNKTTESYSTNNPNINSIRNSCVLNTSLTSSTRVRQQTPEQKVFKSTKENHDPVVQKYRDNFGRYNSVMPSPNFNQQRRKRDSVHYRTPSRQESTLKFEEQHIQPKIANTEQIRAQIAALAKRVNANQQQIIRLKQRSSKDKKWQNLQSELSEYRNKIIQYYKFNSNHFGEIQSKMQAYQKQLGQLRQRCFKYGQNQHLYNTHSFENKLRQLQEDLWKKQNLSNEQIIKQTTAIQNSIKKWVNNQISMLNNRLQKTSESFSTVNRKITKLQQNFEDKNKRQEYKRSHKKSSNSFTLENKEVLIIKQQNKDGQLFRDKSKHFSNYYDSSSKKQYYDQTPRKDYSARKQSQQSKRQLIIKQKTYYIDSEGYLLDENKYYLLNNQNQQILIPEHIILCLKDNNVLTRR